MREKKLQFIIFDKNGCIVNSGTCENANTFKDYKIVKKWTKGTKTFEIVERYFDNELFSKDYSSFDTATDICNCFFWYAIEKRDLSRYSKAEIL